MSATYGERLAQALEAAKKSRAELAAVLRSPDGGLGISVSAVGQVIKGTSKSLTAENSAIAARFLKVNHYWLATGIGLMTEKSSPSAVVLQEPAPAWQSTDLQVLRQLQALLRRVEPAMRPSVADLLAAWARDGGDNDRSSAICRLIEASDKQRQQGRAAGM